MNLYEIGVNGAIIQQYLMENDGELSPEQEEQMDAFLLAGKDKLEGAAQFKGILDAAIGKCDAEIERVTKRKQGLKNKLDYLKARMLYAVDAAFNGKVETPLYTISGQTSAATVGFELEPDADLAAIAETNPEIVRRKFELNKIALQIRHDNHEQIPHGIHIVENPGKRSLRVR